MNQVFPVNKQELSLMARSSSAPLKIQALAVFIICICGLASGLLGCATRISAVGAWTREPDLHVSKEGLKNLKVKVSCLRERDPGRLESRWFRFCSALEDHFESLGAEIADENAPSDFTLQFIESGLTQDTYLGLSAVASVFTGLILPFVTTHSAQAELRVLDGRGAVLDSVPLSLVDVRAYGWMALAGIGSSESEQTKTLSRLVFRVATNRLTSFARVAARTDRGGEF